MIRCIKCDISVLSNNVFGVGNKESDIIFIGEAPGYYENKYGKPFAGDSGKLLNEMLHICGFKRNDVFITNAIKCRPEQNRTPDEIEIRNCRIHLIQEIIEIKPTFIVLLGTTALRGLCGIYKDIDFKKVRNKWFTFMNINCILIYHPSYILRNPETKDEYLDTFKIITDKYKEKHQLHIVNY